MEDRIGAMVAEFRSLQPLYEELGALVYPRLLQMLESQRIRVHSVTYRVKHPDSLAEKLRRQGKEYRSLSDVTDLLGLRVITYFADDVDRVVALVDGAFAVDPERSVDKRRAQEPDRFGYASVHKICRLAADPGEPAAVRRLAGLSFEIQIRSILQHAWAEIEHDLGYKAAHTIPAPIRRRFSILASLLELADDEFIRLRNELAAYSQQLSEAVRSRPEAVAIDPVSLAAFIRTDPACRQLDEAVAGVLGAGLGEMAAGTPEALADQLRGVGIRTLGELAAALAKHRDRVLGLARAARAPEGSPRRGLGVEVLVQVLAGGGGEPGG